MGIESLAECLDDGRIESDGLTAHVDALSLMAEAERLCWRATCRDLRVGGPV